MATQPGKRPTLADVAARSGMSKAAVSMILNDRPGSRLSAGAVARVRLAADELGYRPNPAAQSLRSGKTQTIGFVSDKVTITRYASGMIRGVLDAAKEHGYTVLLAETSGEEGGIGQAIDDMMDRRVDGIVVGLLGARLIALPERQHTVPIVIANGASTAGHPNVLPDEDAAGRAVARVLVDAGHRTIGLIGDIPRIENQPHESITIDVRSRAITEVFHDAGARVIRVDVDDWSPAIGYDETVRLIAAHPEITAIVAMNDNVAFGVYQALTERQIAIPERISVISFDDEEVAAYQRPGLTTARLPYEEIAREAVEMLVADREATHALVPMPVITRESVAPPRASAAAGG